jgi:autotransporter-associated beta strand protein
VISDVIADETQSGGSGINAGTLRLNINGAGTLDLSAPNSFGGGVSLGSGALMLADPNAAGTGTIAFGAGPASLLLGTAALSGTIAFSNSVQSFQGGDTIDLAGIAPGNISTSGTTGTVTVTYAPGHSFALALQSNSSLVASSDNAGGTVLTAICFLAGTLIRTVHGEVPVERLEIGDFVYTWSGGKRPISWIGKGDVFATRGRRTAATPVIVRRNAIADGVPCRDLHVTKGHSLFLDGVLIPVEFLINHRSIVYNDHIGAMTIYHVELDAHDVLIADGAPAESYRDDGNRWLFQNMNPAWDVPDKPHFAAVHTGGPIVDAVWRRLLDRCGLGRPLTLTDDPDLYLWADGERVDAVMCRGTAWTFTLSREPDELRIVSRFGSPAELGIQRDPRPLGVAIRRVAVLGSGQVRAIGFEDETLVDGWHSAESDNGFRWTDGDAAVPPFLFRGIGRPFMVELTVRSTGKYQIGGMMPTIRHRAA